jgi:hypothetical protein
MYTPGARIIARPFKLVNIYYVMPQEHPKNFKEDA